MSLADVLESIQTLPERFEPPLDSLKARFRLNVANVSRDVIVNGAKCKVVKCEGDADAEISTDALTWHEMESGKLSGIEAFAAKRLSIRGSIEQALRFEPLFAREGDGFRYRIDDIKAPGGYVSALVAGDEGAEPLLLLHGLGATKASWLTILPQLARSHRVIAVDLPGHGASDKPFGRYDAPWFAHRVCGVLDALDIDRAFVAGNSMGGRIALELGMEHPERVKALACLCPAAAFSKRPALGLVRWLRPEMGMLASRLPRNRILPQMKQLFADPGCLEDAWYEAAIDDFLNVWKSPRARLAFFTSLRNIYLDEPDGERGFWTRLAAMDRPALFVYGQRDLLISHHFARKVVRTLPAAEVVVWNDCGHVPQIEFPDRSAGLLNGFFSRTARSRVSA